MKNWHMAAWITLGAFIMLTNTVNTIMIGILNPLLTTVKGSYS